MESRDASVTCASCGASIEPKRFVAEVTCSYCNQTQPNPAPFDAGQEVVFEDQTAWTLGHVVVCHGPNAIEVSTAGERPRRFDELLAVVRPPAPPAAGEQVFFKSVIGWQRSWIVDADAQQVTVQNPSPGFDDSFFDAKIALSEVRIPLLERQRSRRPPPKRARLVKALVGGVLVVTGYAIYLWLFG